MLKDIVKVMSWYHSVLKKFFAVSPGRFLYGVSVSFLIECLQMIVFIVPLKILILVGGPSVPAYLSKLPFTATKIEWVTYLTSLVVAAFVFVMVLQKLLSASANSYAVRFVDVNKKGGWANNNFIKEVYLRLAQSTSNSYIALLMFLLILYLYEGVAIFFVVSTLLLTLALAVNCIFSETFSINLKAEPAKYIRVFAVPIFLLTFCYIVFDFMAGSEPPILLVAIISLILVRQIIAALTQKVVSVFWCLKKEIDIQKLFFRGYAASVKGDSGRSDLWSVLKHGGTVPFVRDVIASLGYEEFDVVQCRWVESNVTNFYLLEAELSGGCLEPGNVILLKVYEKHRAQLALRDELVYPGLRSVGLLPDVLGCVSVGEFNVHVLSVLEDWKFAKDDAALNNVLPKIIDLNLGEDFLEEYLAEHPIFWDRLSLDLLGRMRIAASKQEDELITKFIDYLPNLQFRLQKVPLALMVPMQILTSSMISTGNRFQIITLGNWNLEPLGVGLPMNRSVLTALHLSRHFRPGNIFEEEVALLSKLGILENQCRQGRLLGAIATLTDLLEDETFRSLVQDGSRIQVTV